MINTPKNLSPHEVDLYISGFKFCENLIKERSLTISDAVETTASKYDFLISDSDLFKQFLYKEVTAYTEPAIGVVDNKLNEKDWWDELKRDNSFLPEYWQRYYHYLRKKPSWSLTAVDEIDRSTDEIMNALANPRKGVANDRMGIVFGYVQSGKTAHYIGLINKAYDAGYRVVIVLTGIHNSLRSQTQSRIDEEVLGYETSLENIVDLTRERNAIGVGVGPHNQVTEVVQSITTRADKGDVNKVTESVSMMPPFIIVTKKNATVLRTILRFFRKNHCAEVINGKKIIPAKYPALIIDDEADQASINTNETYDEFGNVLDDYNPSTINGLIRELLKVFECRSYAGYTATPFANIFIPPHVDSEKYGTDVFPRDFIFRTPRADQYIGAREFFGISGDENTPVMPLFRNIESGATFLGKGTKATDAVTAIPEDLKKAIKYFLISTALRNCRGQVNKPNTMLVHIVRFVSQQNMVKKLVKAYYEEEIENYIKYGDRSIEKNLKSIWEEDYLPTTSKLRAQFAKYMDGCKDVSWEEIWPEIQRIVTKKEISIYSVNGKSKDALLYKNHEGMPFNVIVIGGDKLSRGLTLEGLTVSYFTRNSNTYDTLMQMGRWFGFRPGYLDACRLFTTPRLNGLFAHISMATEDLAAQFDFMNDDADQTPADFGFRVASHPSLEITSKNKLRTGQEINRDFSSKLSQTRVFDIDGDQYDRNFAAVENLLFAIRRCRITSDQYEALNGRPAPGKHYFWTNVSAYDIANFFENYETSKTATRANSKYMADYVRTLNTDGIGGVKNWTVCLFNVGNGTPFSIAGIEVGGGIFREEGHGVSSYDTTCSIHTMTSAGHEYYDYSQSLLDDVNALREQYKNDQSVYKVNELIRKKTRPFEKGLLLLYPIADAGALTKNRGEHKPPFGFAAVFPDRKGRGNLQSYRMNDIALEKDNDEFYG